MLIKSNTGTHNGWISTERYLYIDFITSLHLLLNAKKVEQVKLFKYWVIASLNVSSLCYSQEVFLVTIVSVINTSVTVRAQFDAALRNVCGLANLFKYFTYYQYQKQI